jgi:hypothetical protein
MAEKVKLSPLYEIPDPIPTQETRKIRLWEVGGKGRQMVNEVLKHEWTRIDTNGMNLTLEEKAFISIQTGRASWSSKRRHCRPMGSVHSARSIKVH